jgi:hypothetical protein
MQGGVIPGPTTPPSEAHLYLVAGSDVRAQVQTFIDAAVARGCKRVFLHGLPGVYLLTKASGVNEDGEGYCVHLRTLIEFVHDEGMLFTLAAAQFTSDPTSVLANRVVLFFSFNIPRLKLRIRGDGNGANQTWPPGANKDSVKLVKIVALSGGDIATDGPIELDLEARNFRGMCVDVRGNQNRTHNLLGTVNLKYKGYNNGGDCQFSRLGYINHLDCLAVTDATSGWRCSNSFECANCYDVNYANVTVREINGRRMTVGGGGCDHGGSKRVRFGTVHISDQPYGIKGNVQFNSERRITENITGSGPLIENCAAGYYGLSDGRVNLPGMQILGCTTGILGWAEDAVILPFGLAASDTAGKFKTTLTARYVASHVTYTKPPADNLTFSSGTTIAAGKWGTILFSADSSGAITTWAETTQAYNTQAEAVINRLTALVGAGSTVCEAGYVVIQAPNGAPWVANTNNLTTDCQSITFVDDQRDVTEAVLDGLVIDATDQAINLTGKSKIIGSYVRLRSPNYCLYFDRFSNAIGYSPSGTPWVELKNSTIQSDGQVIALIQGDDTDSWSPVILLDNLSTPLGSDQRLPNTTHGGTTTFLSFDTSRGFLPTVGKFWREGTGLYKTDTLNSDNAATVAGDPVKNWVEQIAGTLNFTAPSDGERGQLATDRKTVKALGSTPNLVAAALMTAPCTLLTRLYYVPFTVQAVWSSSSSPGPEDVYITNGSGGTLAMHAENGDHVIGRPGFLFDQVVGLTTDGTTDSMIMLDYRGYAFTGTGTFNPSGASLWLFNLRGVAFYAAAGQSGLKNIWYIPRKFTSEEAENANILMLRGDVPASTQAATTAPPSMPQNNISADHTVTAAEDGKRLYHPGSDTTARTWTIDSNAGLALPIGFTITYVNDTSAGAITMAVTSDTAVWFPSGATGNRTLAADGVATWLKVAATRWVVTGVGIS